MTARSMLSVLVFSAAWALGAPASAQEVVDTSGLAEVEALARMIRWGGVFVSTFVILAAWLLLRFVSALIEQAGTVFVERRLLMQKLGAFFRFGVYLTTIVSVVFLSFRISREVLAILGGTSAVALGFAMKDLVASLVAGVMIILDRPFQVGDRVEFAGEYGDIVSIGLRSVKLRTLTDSIVTIPNNMFLTQATSCGNYGVLHMQIAVDFLIGSDQNIVRAQEIVHEAAVTSPYVYLPNPITVRVAQVAIDSYVALRLRLKAYVLDTKHEKTFETDVTLRVIEAFAQADIQPPAILHRSVGPPEEGAAAAERNAA